MSRSHSHKLLSLLLLLAFAGPAIDSAAAEEQQSDPIPLVAPFDLAKAEEAQTAWSRHLKVERTAKTKSGVEMVLIPPGEYLRGTSAEDVAAALLADPDLNAENFAAEQPQHRVQITKPFYMAKFETTQRQYQHLVGHNPSAFSASGDQSDRVIRRWNTANFPVERMTWYDCLVFCNRLSEAEGKPLCYELSDIKRTTDLSIVYATVRIISDAGYRLPTEAEWEYACRAGTTTVFYFGNQLHGEQANIKGKDSFGTRESGPYFQRTSKVGKHPQNNFGLHDMCGNVWEWCQDGFDESAYTEFLSQPAVDPIIRGDASPRVLRGGSWFSTGRFTRSATRFKMPPASRRNTYGFRVVCSCDAAN